MLRIFIETMTGCLGGCHGCVFTVDERRDRLTMEPDINDIMEEFVKPKVEPYGYTTAAGFLYHKHGKDDYNQKPISMDLPYIVNNAEEIAQSLREKGYAD